MEACCIEHVAQKARREVETKAREEVEMKRRGLKMVLGKVRRRELRHLPPARIVVLLLLFNFYLNSISFSW